MKAAFLLASLGLVVLAGALPPIPDFTAPIPLLYNQTKFKAMPANGATTAPIPQCCPGVVTTSSVDTPSPGCPMTTLLDGSASTAHWGYWYDGLAPQMVVAGDGDEIEVNMPTFVQGAAFDLMGEGDDIIEEQYLWDKNGPLVNMRGPYGNAGGHFMTGPIYVCGAEAGDIVQVDILDLQPRINPGNNRSFGITINSGIGWHYKVGYTAESGYAKDRSVQIVYEAIRDPATERAAYWEPLYSFDTSTPLVKNKQPGCVPQNGSIPHTTDAGAGMWFNPDYSFGPKPIPCTADGQDFTYPNTGYSGQVLYVPEEAKDYSIQGKYRVPINMHIGNMGLAPKIGVPIITSPPMRTGGNLDDKRIGIGASMYYPVEVAGALLSMGDCHGAQGDGESSGTGIETSLDGKFRITLHKRDALPEFLSTVDYPLLENENEFVVHGYAYKDWIREIKDPQTNVSKYGPYGGVDMNRAMNVVYNQTRDFVKSAFNVSEDIAINVMSNVIDFGITQIVDSNIGLHSIIPKWPFNASAWESEPYYQAKNKCGTSRTSYP